MIIIACIDEKGGMLFNNRRQSKDRVLIQHIMQMVGNHTLWITSFSSKLFEEYIGSNAIVDDDFLSKIQDDDFVFIEDLEWENIQDKIHKVILYNWNKKYPADKYFELSQDKWQLLSEQDITGSSHDKITEKVYIRGNI